MSIDPKEIDHIRDTGDNLWSQQMDGVDLATGRPPIVARLEQKVDQLLALAKAADVTAALTALKAELDGIQNVLQSGTGTGVPIDLSRLYAQLGNLGKHLGVDVTTGTDT